MKQVRKLKPIFSEAEPFGCKNQVNISVNILTIKRKIKSYGCLIPLSFLKNVLLCELLTAFGKFPKYLLSLNKYSTLKVPDLCFAKI